MKLLILGATGDVGAALLQEAMSRGHVVTACARNASRLADLGGDLQVETLDVVRDSAALEKLCDTHDAVISALRPPTGAEQDLVTLTREVLNAAKATRTTTFITGGAATLKIADRTKHTVLSAPGFLPDAVLPIAKACAAQDALLDEFPDVAWTCLRPPAMLEHGSRTGRYALGRDTLVKAPDGRSRISFADFAVAMLDLVELQPAPRQRLTVGS